MEKRTRIIQGILSGAIASAILVVALTIAADLYKPLKDFLKNTFHHHWVGKGILAAILLAVIGAASFVLVRNGDDARTIKLIKILSWVLVCGMAALMAFFTWEYFRHE